MSATFTPGPWSVGVSGYSPAVYAKGRGICRVEKGTTGTQMWHQKQPLEAEAKANARLIAAAPELYSALEALVTKGHEELTVADLFNGERALRKARGEPS